MFLSDLGNLDSPLTLFYWRTPSTMTNKLHFSKTIGSQILCCTLLPWSSWAAVQLPAQNSRHMLPLNNTIFYLHGFQDSLPGRYSRKHNSPEPFIRRVYFPLSTSCSVPLSTIKLVSLNCCSEWWWVTSCNLLKWAVPQKRFPRSTIVVLRSGRVWPSTRVEFGSIRGVIPDVVANHCGYRLVEVSVELKLFCFKSFPSFKRECLVVHIAEHTLQS